MRGLAFITLSSRAGHTKYDAEGLYRAGSPGEAECARIVWAVRAANRKTIEASLMRVLLVEDEPSAARFIAKGLREAAYAVDVVENGTTAATQCYEYDYDA